MSDIFREIEEELRRDNLLKLWQRYGKYVIAAAVLALLIVGGIVAWREHEASERRAQGQRYSNALALVREGKDGEAAKVFAQLAREGGGYSLLAAFEEAGLLAKTGDRKGSIAAYDRIASAPGIDPEFRDLALLLSATQLLADGDAGATIAHIQKLTANGNPWRASALDLTAAAKLKAGDRSGALAIYKELTDDLSAPQGLRARAAEMAAALKS